MQNAPDLSIVIVSWNTKDLLMACLRSIAQHARVSYEVVVVDNNSHDGSAAMVKEQFPEVRLIASVTNEGFSRANNKGWQAATGRFVFFLNADTELIEDPFPALLAAARQDDAVGAVGPALLNSDRTPQRSVRKFPTWADQVMTLLKLRQVLGWTPAMRRYREMPPRHGDSPIAVDEVMGAAVLVPRTILDTVGGWDEGYWIWFEDVDLCQRLHRLGKKVLYVPAAKVIHHGGSSFGQVLSLKKHVWFLRALWRYSGKFWTSLQHWSLAPLIVVSYLLTVVQTLVKPR